MHDENPPRQSGEGHVSREDLRRISLELQTVFNLSETVIATLMEKFFASCAVELEKLRAAIPKKDFEQIMQSAHSIKGAAATLHFDHLAQEAEKLEKCSLREEAYDYDAALQALEAALGNIADVYQQR